MSKPIKIEVTNRTKIKRMPKRAVYDFDMIAKILDDSFICHIGFSVNGQIFVIPTCYGRANDRIYFHGAKGSRMLENIKAGSEICITVTILDGIVLARSAFHHSVNYRSVVIFGKAEELLNKSEKTEALRIITEQILPGRWNDVRKPNDKELNVTTVFSLKINEASAKVREGGPIDDEEDMDLNVWAGVLPLKINANEPINSSDLKGKIKTPEYILSSKY
jgi:uncharacterized protein